LGSKRHEFDLSGSREVIGHVTIWCPTTYKFVVCGPTTDL